MAITSTLLLGERSTVASTAFITSSASPSSGANSMVLAAVFARNITTASMAATPTVQGWGLTWTNIHSISLQQGGNASRRLSLYRSSGTAVPGGRSTIHFAGTTNAQGVIWCFVGLGGVDTASPVVQSTYNQSTVSQAGWTVNLGAISTANASFGVFGSVCTTNVTTGSGFAVAYANSTFTITSTSFPLNFFNELAIPAQSAVSANECANAMNQGIAVEIKARAQPDLFASISAPSVVTATLTLRHNHHIASSISAPSAVTATLSRSVFQSIAASMASPVAVTATLSVGAVTKALSASIATSAAVTATLSRPEQTGRPNRTTRLYDLIGKIVVNKEGIVPITETFDVANSSSPLIWYTETISTGATLVSLVDRANVDFVCLIPASDNTAPVRMALADGEDGISLSSRGASFVAVGAPTTGFNLRTTVENSQLLMRVGLL